ncbi:hypothetical protein AVEN_146769-1 [Araneus ventricosus]|uniref:Uncharacterized protein n=1 Tax=Araneus ventricosus TaxID=182803 RepID=A0A4Y2DAK2_ARAVE|nr:hypothetical protein AVEN_146769-1 [Araneus ventricosus]
MHSVRLSDLDRILKERKSHTLKNNKGNQIKINHSFLNVKRQENCDLYQIRRSRVHLRLRGTDPDSNKKTTDIGCDHQQMQLSALEKLDDIFAHSSTTDDEMIRDLFFNKN